MTDDIQDEGLREALGALPREIQPERDLWPEIAARIAPRRRFTQRWLAAAAVAGLIVTGSIVAGIVGPRGHAPVKSYVVMPAPHGAASGPAYSQARASTIAATIRSSTRLDPQTQAVLLHNLGIIETSLANIQQALQKDPDNAGLQSLLFQMYRDEAALVAAAQRVQLQTATGVAL